MIFGWFIDDFPMKSPISRWFRQQLKPSIHRWFSHVRLAAPWSRELTCLEIVDVHRISLRLIIITIHHYPSHIIPYHPYQNGRIFPFPDTPGSSAIHFIPPVEVPIDIVRDSDTTLGFLAFIPAMLMLELQWYPPWHSRELQTIWRRETIAGLLAPVPHCWRWLEQPVASGCDCHILTRSTLVLVPKIK